MAHQFTVEETKAWHADQPKKMISSKVALLNPSGQVLILQPNYKPGWNFPGGIVNANESPLLAAVRECHEEIGLDLDPSRLSFLGMRYGISKKTGLDYLHMLFQAKLTDEEVQSIVLDTNEVTASQWVELEMLAGHITDQYGQFAQDLLTGASDATYSDNDTFLA